MVTRSPTGKIKCVFATIQNRGKSVHFGRSQKAVAVWNLFDCSWDAVKRAVANGKRVKPRDAPEFVGGRFLPQDAESLWRLLLDKTKLFQTAPCNGDSSSTCIDFKRTTRSINFDINDETFWVFVEIRLF